MMKWIRAGVAVAGLSVALPALKLATNTVTMCGWIKANGAQPLAAGLMLSRSGTTVAGLTIDLSPTKHVVFLLLAAFLVVLLLGIAARGIEAARRENRAPRGFAGAMEAMVLFALW